MFLPDLSNDVIVICDRMAVASQSEIIIQDSIVGIDSGRHQEILDAIQTKDEFSYSRVRQFENFWVQFNYFFSSTQSNLAELTPPLGTAESLTGLPSPSLSNGILFATKSTIPSQTPFTVLLAHDFQMHSCHLIAVILEFNWVELSRIFEYFLPNSRLF